MNYNAGFARITLKKKILRMMAFAKTDASKLHAACLVLAILTFLLYKHITAFQYVNYDDPEWISANANLSLGLTCKGLLWAGRAVIDGTWNPIPAFSFLLEHQIFGSNPAVSHSINLFIHIANALLLLNVLMVYTGAFWRSVLVASLFAWHPVNVETVAWVAERKGVLSGTAFLSTLLIYERYVRHSTFRNYGLVYALSLVSLLTKPVLITMPFVLLLLDWWPLKRFAHKVECDSSYKDNAWICFEKVPLFILSALDAYIVVCGQLSANGVVSLDAVPIWTRVENAVFNYFTYLENLIMPSKLIACRLYSGPPDHFHLFLALTILIILTYFACKNARRSPHLFVGWALFVGVLFPTIGIVQIGHEPVSDRYLYLPAIGIFIMIGWTLPEPACFLIRRVMIGTIVVLLLSLARVTYKQEEFWRDSVSLFNRTVLIQPANWVAHNNLGVALAVTRRDYSSAQQHFSEALRLNPQMESAAKNLGIARRQESGDSGVREDATNLNSELIKEH